MGKFLYIVTYKYIHGKWIYTNVVNNKRLLEKNKRYLFRIQTSGRVRICYITNYSICMYMVLCTIENLAPKKQKAIMGIIKPRALSSSTAFEGVRFWWYKKRIVKVWDYKTTLKHTSYKTSYILYRVDMQLNLEYRIQQFTYLLTSWKIRSGIAFSYSESSPNPEDCQVSLSEIKL